MPDRNEVWAPSLRQGKAVSEDGTRVAYQVVGQGTKTMLLANGLGGRLYAWAPLLEKFWPDYRIITWDYRGLFESRRKPGSSAPPPESGRRLAVAGHVEDAMAILRKENVERAVLVGWSMGVQVSLDVAAHHPTRVAGLVLINGTYGHTLSSGFQPLFSVPYLPKQLHHTIEFIRRRPHTEQRLAQLVRYSEVPTSLLFMLTAGRRALSLRPLLRRYMDEVLGPSFDNFMRLFQELDAHSVYHLLPDVEAPALVISGSLDIITPARQSREIARRMPNAERMNLLRASHFALLERPEKILPAIESFLDNRAEW